jgi:hypothetical protein
MQDVHNIIAALMTNQSAEGVEMIKTAIGTRAETAIGNFVAGFDYAKQPEQAVEVPPNDNA